MLDPLYGALRLTLAPIADVYFPLAASGAERVPAGACILAANHSSLLDWVFVARAVPRPVRFVLARDFFDQPGLTWLYRRLGVIPIRDGQIEHTAVRQLLATLARGEIVGAFPEGRITRTGALLPAQPGMIAIAARAAVPIVPVGIRGAFEAFPREARVPRRHPVRVRYGVPYRLAADAARDRDAQRREAAALMARIAELCAEA